MIIQIRGYQQKNILPKFPKTIYDHIELMLQKIGNRNITQLDEGVNL